MYDDHSFRAFAARVAYCARLKRAEFTEEEILLIENSHHYGDSPVDTAYMLQNHRAIDMGRMQNAGN